MRCAIQCGMRSQSVKSFVKICLAAAVLFGVAVFFFHDTRAEETAGPAKSLEIYFMYNEGEIQQKWFAAAVERFKEWKEGQGDPVSVDVVYAGREVLGKVRPRLIIGNPPDLVNQGDDGLRILMEDGLLERIDDGLDAPALDENVPWRDTFLPGLVDLDKYEGHSYMAPVGLFASFFFYDKRVFRKYGLEEPRTWSEFLHVCQVLKDNGIAPIAADGTEPGYNAMWYAILLTRYTTVDRILATAKNEPGTSWTDPPFVEAARRVCELRDRGYIMPGYEGSKWPSAQMQWMQGKCGLLYCGSWIPKEMKDATPPGFEMGIFPFPVVEGYEKVSDCTAQDLGMESFAIPKGARHKETALEFLKFITTQAETKDLVAMDIPPAVRGAGMPESLAGLDAMIAPPYKLIKGMAGITNELPEWYRTCARDSWSEIFLGRYTPEEFSRLLEGAHKRYYERLKALGQESQK